MGRAVAGKASGRNDVNSVLLYGILSNKARWGRQKLWSIDREHSETVTVGPTEC